MVCLCSRRIHRHRRRACSSSTTRKLLMYPAPPAVSLMIAARSNATECAQEGCGEAVVPAVLATVLAVLLSVFSLTPFVRAAPNGVGTRILCSHAVCCLYSTILFAPASTAISCLYRRRRHVGFISSGRSTLLVTRPYFPFNRTVNAPALSCLSARQCVLSAVLGARAGVGSCGVLPLPSLRRAAEPSGQPVPAAGQWRRQRHVRNWWWRRRRC